LTAGFKREIKFLREQTLVDVEQSRRQIELRGQYLDTPPLEAGLCR
jgi:hypothetical protein